MTLVKDIKLGHRGRIKEYAERVPGCEYHEGCKGVWTVPCDIALPCATQNEIDAAGRHRLSSPTAATVVCEGANMPLHSGGNRRLPVQNNACSTAPAKAANAGGVASLRP